MEVLSEIFLAPEIPIKFLLDTDYVKDRRADPDSRVKGLMAMILFRSLLDLGKNEELVEDALAWIFSNERRWIFSFLFICKVLFLDPGQIREAVRSKDFYRSFLEDWHHFSLIDQGILRP